MMRQVLTILITATIFAAVGMSIGKNHKHSLVGEGGDGVAKAVESKADTAADYERGPHQGRLLRDGDLSLEVTIFEEGAPPKFHVYPYLSGKPLSPDSVTLTIELGRLGNEIDNVTFAPNQDYLESRQIIVEPHSFLVSVRAQYKDTSSQWNYQSFEGRTQISAKAAEGAALRIETVGPADIQDNIELSGSIALNQNRIARVGGRFAGFVKSINKQVGQAVRAGDVLATIDRNVSLGDYNVVAPIDGVIVNRAATVGMATTTESTLFEIADLSTVWAELYAFGRDKEVLKVGQAVVVENQDKSLRADGTVEYVTPIAEPASQSVVVRVLLDNKSAKWIPGSFIRGILTVSKRTVPLAVKATALQRFRDSTVAFRRVDDIYEVRMLELGATDGTWTEVRNGIKAGDEYVSDNSFLVKADIEKSGASHDH